MCPKLLNDNETLGSLLIPCITSTKRLMSPPGLFSHINDEGDLEPHAQKRHVGTAQDEYASQRVEYPIRILYYLNVTNVESLRTLLTYQRWKGARSTPSRITNHDPVFHTGLKHTKGPSTGP